MVIFIRIEKNILFPKLFLLAYNITKHVENAFFAEEDTIQMKLTISHLSRITLIIVTTTDYCEILVATENTINYCKQYKINKFDGYLIHESIPTQYKILCLHDSKQVSTTTLIILIVCNQQKDTMGEGKQ